MNNRTSKYVNSVFEQPWWLDTVAPNAWKEILIEEAGEVIARWPLVENSKGIEMPKLTQTLGFWFADKVTDNDICYNNRKRITNLLLEQLPINKNINIRLDPRVEYFLPMHWKNFVIKPRISYMLNDLGNIDVIYESLPKMVKENIRRAKKKVTITTRDDIGILLMLLDRTFGRQNIKNPWSGELIRNIYNACKDYSACKLLYAIGENGDTYSGALFVYDQNICHALVGGTDPKYRSSGAFSLLLWEGIKFASTVSRSFNFMGSMIEGIENFLRQFGGTPIVYYNIQRHKQSKIKAIVLEVVKLLKLRIKSLIGFSKWHRIQPT